MTVTQVLQQETQQAATQDSTDTVVHKAGIERQAKAKTIRRRYTPQKARRIKPLGFR